MPAAHPTCKDWYSNNWLLRSEFFFLFCIHQGDDDGSILFLGFSASQFVVVVSFAIPPEGS